MYCVIDTVGYCGLSNDLFFVPKEVQVIREDGQSRYYLIKPYVEPDYINENQRRVIHWATLRNHCIPYAKGSYGLISFEEELSKFTKNCDRIFTKGKHKLDYLTKVLYRHQLYDLGHLGCPSIKNATTQECPNHLNPTSRCACEGAKFLINWIHGHQNGAAASSAAQQIGEEQPSCGCVLCQPLAE
jgi:hypothetical protein